MKFIREFLLFGFILAFLVGNLIKPGLFLAEVHPTVLDMFVAVSFSYILLFHRRHIRTAFMARREILYPALVFSGIAALSLILSLLHYLPIQVLVGSLYLFRFAAYLSLAVTLPVLFVPSSQDLLIRWIMLSVVAVSFLQYLLFPDVRGLQVAEWDPHYFRVVGSFLDPGFTSILLCFTLFRLWHRPEFRRSWVNLLVWGIVYLLFALTYSRSGYLAFLAGWAFLAYRSRSFKKFVYPLVLVVATILLLPRSPGGEGVKLERTSSIEARVINWGHSVKIFLDRPILGVGFNTYRYAQKQYGFLDGSGWLRSHAGAGADSSLLFVAATTGLLGLASYLFWLKRLWFFTQKDLLFHTYLIALAAHSLFLNSLFYPFVLFWLFLNLPKNKPQSGS